MKIPVSIVAKESWLRSFPTAVDPEFRLIVDSLVYSADAISYAFNALNAHLAEIPKFEKYTDFDSAPIFLYCWSIVDEFNAALKMLIFYERKMGGSGLGMRRLMDKLGEYNTLRRGFRHIHEQIKNLAKSKSKDALIGSISWLAWPDAEKHEFRTYVLKKGLLHGTDKLPVVNPADLRLAGPVSHATFTAYGVSVTFYELIEQFSFWMEENFNAVRA